MAPVQRSLEYRAGAVCRWLFGIYTRRTGSGSHGWGGRCTRTASSALSGEVRAISPVDTRPSRGRRCAAVTCRTLTSVFDQAPQQHR